METDSNTNGIYSFSPLRWVVTQGRDCSGELEHFYPGYYSKLTKTAQLNHLLPKDRGLVCRKSDRELPESKLSVFLSQISIRSQNLDWVNLRRNRGLVTKRSCLVESLGQIAIRLVFTGIPTADYLWQKVKFYLGIRASPSRPLLKIYPAFSKRVRLEYSSVFSQPSIYPKIEPRLNHLPFEHWCFVILCAKTEALFLSSLGKTAIRLVSSHQFKTIYFFISFTLNVNLLSFIKFKCHTGAVTFQQIFFIQL